MKIGTDGSLKTCNEEGYTVIDFKVRELYPNGRKGGINKEHPVEFYACIPDHLRADMSTPENPFGTGKLWSVCVSWIGLIEIFEQHEASIPQLVGQTREDLIVEYPDEYSILHLGDAIQAYCGIE